MSQEKPNTRIDDQSKAWDMAHAEKPFREKKLALIAQRKQEFKDRFSELGRMANDDTIDITNIKPNADEKFYANDSVVKTKSSFENVGQPLPTDPHGTAAIAKELIEQKTIRAHRTLTRSSSDMEHPLGVKVNNARDAVRSEAESSSIDWANTRSRSVNEDRLELMKRLDEELTDPSRSIAGDKAANKWVRSTMIVSGLSNNLLMIAKDLSNNLSIASINAAGSPAKAAVL